MVRCRAARGWCARPRPARGRRTPTPPGRVRRGRAAGRRLLSRRWCALNAACTTSSSGSAGSSSTRPTTERVTRTGQPAPAQDATSRSSSSAVSMSSRADAVIRPAPESSSGASRVMSRRRVSRVSGPAPAGTAGGSAGTSASSSTSRSYRIQCWGPGSRGASQRAIDPLPDPRSWTTRSRPSGRCGRSASTSSTERAAASAGSRRVSQPALARTGSVDMTHLLPARSGAWTTGG